MQDKDLYTLALLKYQKENRIINIDQMFSIKWNLSKDYRLKTKIIAEAIKKNILVEDTELYQKNFIEPN